MELQRKIELLESQINLRKEKVEDYNSSIKKLEELRIKILELEKVISSTNVESVKNELAELEEWRNELCQSLISTESQSLI